MKSNDPALRHGRAGPSADNTALSGRTVQARPVFESMGSDSVTQPLEVRCYGKDGSPVVLVHGGPGAAGYMAPVARYLAEEYRVIEPLQRQSGTQPLTVQRHADDLLAVLKTFCRGVRPVLVGHSWGAMLALAFAAAYPDSVCCVALIGCGTFDPQSRAALEQSVRDRMTPFVVKRLKAASRQIRDADVRLCVVARILEPLYSYELLPHQDETVCYDARGQRETWADMLRLQRDGTYPATFRTIRQPVLMLHGDTDPHPGSMIRDTLLSALPQLDYVELPRCGHFPWLERYSAEAFFAALTNWVAENTR